MNNATNYLENKLLDHVLRGTVYTPPTLYVALYTSGTGLEENTPTGEVTGGGYARAKVSDFGGYTAASGGSSSNAAHIEFPAATVNWGTITHMALCDAATAGNVLIWAPFDTARDITAGDAVRINANANVISFE